MEVQKGVGDSASAVGDQSNTNVSDSDAINENIVVKAGDHERLLKDTHRYKEEAKRWRAEAEKSAKERRESEDRKLAEANEFKVLYERTAAERDAERAEKQKLIDSYYTNQKISSVRSEALKAGLRPEAEADLDLIGLDSVAIERTDQGRVIVHGTEEFVQNLKKTRPHWFGNTKVANINSGGTNSTATNQTITPDMLFRLEQEGKKTGKMDGYYAAVKQYSVQRANKK